MHRSNTMDKAPHSPKHDTGPNAEATIEPASKRKTIGESKPNSEPKYADYDRSMKIFKKILKEYAELFNKLKNM